MDPPSRRQPSRLPTRSFHAYPDAGAATLAAGAALGAGCALARERASPLGRPRTPATDDEQARALRLLLLAKGAVLAHPFERPLAAELDEDRQRGASFPAAGLAAIRRAASCGRAASGRGGRGRCR